jgi:hypothetical protein
MKLLRIRVGCDSLERNYSEAEITRVEKFGRTISSSSLELVSGWPVRP